MKIREGPLSDEKSNSHVTITEAEERETSIKHHKPLKISSFNAMSDRGVNVSGTGGRKNYEDPKMQKHTSAEAESLIDRDRKSGVPNYGTSRADSKYSLKVTRTMEEMGVDGTMRYRTRPTDIIVENKNGKDKNHKEDYNPMENPTAHLIQKER